MTRPHLSMTEVTQERCYCGTLKSERHVHTCGVVWPELWLLFKDRRAVEQRTLAAWNFDAEVVQP